MSDGDSRSLHFQNPLGAAASDPVRRPLAHLVTAAAYLVFAASTTGIAGVPLAVAGALITAGVLTARRRPVGDVALPFVVFAGFYHWLGWLRPSVAAAGVQVFFPYWFDKTVFGVGDFADRLSCNELFAIYHWPAIDFIAGIAYLSFLPCVFVFAAYLILLDRRRERVGRAKRFGWTFLGVNVAGFCTYIVCPVAPPWYVAANGFGPVDVAARPSSAALSRWDAMTGIPYFERFYAQATEVFGAMPSLHCAYPALLVLFAWEMRRPRLTAALVGYHLLMCFSAVYLQHHYVTDVIAGTAYSFVIYLVGLMVGPRIGRADPRPARA